MEAFKLFGSLVVEHVDKATQEVEKFSRQVDQTQASLDKTTAAFDQAQKEAEQYAAELNQAQKAAVPAAQAMTKVKDALSKTAAAVGTAGALGAGLKVFVDQVMELGKAGAAVTQTAESFQRLVVGLGGSTDMLGRLQAASRGTVDDVKLMSSTTALLSGTSGELARSLLETTPQLMEMAKAANKLNPTLGDTTYMYESLALGIKRGSPMILDNLGITVSLEQANRKYAQALGVSVDALTKEQQQQALLNAVLDKGNILVQQAGGNTLSAVDSMARLEAATKNLSDELRAGLAPALADAAEGAVILMTGRRKLEQAVSEHGATVTKQAKSYEEYRTELERAAKAAGYTVDAQGNLNRVQQTGGGVIFRLVEANYLLSEAEFEQGKAAEAAREVAERLGDTRAEAIAGTRRWAMTEEELQAAQASAAAAREQAVESIDAYARAMDEAQAAARDLAIQESGLAESLKGADNAALGKEAINQLNQSLRDGKISGSDYQAMVRDIQLSFGLATRESLALAENIGIVTRAAEQGVIPSEKLSEAIETLKKDAGDGSVDVGALLASQGASSEDIGTFLANVEKAAAKNKDLAEQTGNISETATIAREALAEYDGVLLSNKDNSEKAAKATEEYRLKVEELKAQMDQLTDKTVKVTMIQTTTTGTTGTTSGSGQASGLDSFIVPPGYPHDSYPLRVQSGEMVTVTPANERNRAGRGGGMTVWGDLTVVVQGADGLSADEIMARAQVR